MTTQLHFRMDEKDKKEIVLKKVGLTPGETSEFLPRSRLKQGGISFEVSQPNARLSSSINSEDYLKFDGAESDLEWLNNESK